MKTKGLLIFAAIIAMTFTSCEKEEPLTENPEFIPTATGDDPSGGNPNGGGTGGTGGSGGGGGGIPSDFRASTTPANRIAVLEDFTGVRCGFCPDGHEVAAQVETSLGDDFIVIAVHASGTYSSPAPGSDWPNYETPFGDAIKTMADPSGFPAGALNRLPASDLNLSPMRPNGMAMGRGSWTSAANAVVAMSSPVNIGAKATISGSTLTVVVDVYYTDDETDVNHINIALLQNNLFGRQSGGTPDPMNYNNSHVLRALIAGDNPQWGDPITESTTKDSFIRKTYTYTVPADYNGTGADGGGAVVNDDLEVVAFISRGQSDILTAVDVDVE